MAVQLGEKIVHVCRGRGLRLTGNRGGQRLGKAADVWRKAAREESGPSTALQEREGGEETCTPDVERKSNEVSRPQGGENVARLTGE